MPDIVTLHSPTGKWTLYCPRADYEAFLRGEGPIVSCGCDFAAWVLEEARNLSYVGS